MSVLVPALFGLALLPSAFFFGLAAYLFMAPCYDKLSGRAFVEFFRAIDPYMKARARWAALAQLALMLPLLGLTSGLPFALTLAAAVLALAATAVAVRGNVPLNRQMDRWSPDDPPAGWERVRDRWLRFHDVRGAAAVAGFVLLLAAALFDGATRRPDAPTATTGEPARRWEATVYLPLADNAGRSFGGEWGDAVGELSRPFGGVTLGEPLEGCWVDGQGRFVREPVRPVVVSFPPDRLDEFRRVAHAVGRRLGQEAVYVRFEEPRVELIPSGQGR